MFNNIGPTGLLLLAIVVLVLFGRGKVSGLMGEVGKGITSFKKGLNDGKAEIENASQVSASEQARDVTPEKEKV
jgi:sec-independent protein translocase protein TatA